MQPFVIFGASGRSRTGTAVKPRDFKSLVSTNFTTEAKFKKSCYLPTSFQLNRIYSDIILEG